MKLSCLQENLNRGLNIVQRAVATRTTLPITNNVLLATDQSRLKLVATNLEMAITSWIGAKVETDGAITVPGYTGTIQFTSSDTLAVLPAPYPFVAGDNGTHTFIGLVTLKTAGTQSITATDTVTSSITGTQSGITVNPSTAATLTFVQEPTTTVAGQKISPAVTVRARATTISEIKIKIRTPPATSDGAQWLGMGYNAVWLPGQRSFSR
jgi:hypothetical protein